MRMVSVKKMKSLEAGLLSSNFSHFSLTPRAWVHWNASARQSILHEVMPVTRILFFSLLFLARPTAAATTDTIHFGIGRIAAGTEFSHDAVAESSGVVLHALHRGWIRTPVIPLGDTRTFSPVWWINLRIRSEPRLFGAKLEAYVRYGVDGRRWSSWQRVVPTSAGGQAALLSVPYTNRADFLHRRAAWAAKDPPHEDDLWEFCRALARSEPKFFDENIPFVGYVQFLIEASGRQGSLLLNSVDIKGEPYDVEESIPATLSKDHPRKGKRWFFPPLDADIARPAPMLSVSSVPRPDDTDALIIALGGDDLGERWKAVERLKKAGQQALSRLAAALKDRNEERRWMAAMTIYLMGREAEAAAPDLVSALGDESAAVRYRAGEALGRLGASGGFALRDALKDPRPMARAQAALAQVRREVVLDAVIRAGLLDALQVGDSADRQEAVSVLRDQKSVPLEELPTYIRALRTDDVSLRWDIAGAIRKMGEPAVPDLLKALADSDPKLRGGAAAALNFICKLPKAALKPLLAARVDSSGYDRMENTRAIACLGRDAKQALPFLIEDLGRDYYLDRQEVVTALGRIGDVHRTVFPAVLRALSDENRLVRTSAAGALLNFPRRRKAVMDSLGRALRDEDSSVRSAAAQTLGKLEPPALEAAAALIVALSDIDPQVRQSAKEALSRLDDPAVKDALEQTRR